MFLLKGKKFLINKSHVIGDTQYPRGWFKDADNRLAAGITEVDDVPVPDSRQFTWTENEDGTYNTTPIPGALEKIRSDTLKVLKSSNAEAVKQLIDGREFELVVSEKEAQEFKDKLYVGTAPDVVISEANAEAGNTNNRTKAELKAATDRILAEIVQLKTDHEKIRAVRLDCSRKITRAGTVTEIDGFSAEWHSFLKSL